MRRSLLLLALVLVYLYNFRVLDLDRIPYMSGVIKNAYAFLNLGMAGFVMATVTVWSSSWSAVPGVPLVSVRVYGTQVELDAGDADDRRSGAGLTVAVLGRTHRLHRGSVGFELLVFVRQLGRRGVGGLEVLERLQVDPQVGDPVADQRVAIRITELIGPKALMNSSSCDKRDHVQASRLRISPPGSTWYRITRFWSIR